MFSERKKRKGSKNQEARGANLKKKKWNEGLKKLAKAQILSSFLLLL